MLFDEPHKRLLGLAHAALAVRRVDDAGVEHLAGRIDDGDLAAGAVSGVEADGYAALDRRLHQELAQVERKDADRVLVRLFGQLAADLALDGGFSPRLTCRWNFFCQV